MKATLKDLSISMNNLENEGAVIIGEALMNSHSIERLFLGFNGIRDVEAIALAEGLLQNNSLTYIVHPEVFSHARGLYD